MTKTKTEVFDHLIKKYGEKFQYEKGIEECGELVVALSHKLQHRTTNEEVLGEVADVAICIDTIIRVLNTNGSYNQIYSDKIVRIKQREGLV